MSDLRSTDCQAFPSSERSARIERSWPHTHGDRIVSDPHARLPWGRDAMPHCRTNRLDSDAGLIADHYAVSPLHRGRSQGLTRADTPADVHRHPHRPCHVPNWRARFSINPCQSRPQTDQNIRMRFRQPDQKRFPSPGNGSLCPPFECLRAEQVPCGTITHRSTGQEILVHARVLTRRSPCRLEPGPSGACRSPCRRGRDDGRNVGTPRAPRPSTSDACKVPFIAEIILRSNSSPTTRFRTRETFQCFGTVPCTFIYNSPTKLTGWAGFPGLRT